MTTIAVRLTMAVAMLATSTACALPGTGEDLPTKPADYVAVLPASHALGRKLPDERGLTGPHFTLRITHTNVTSKLDEVAVSALDLDQPHAAAPDHQFVLAHFGTPESAKARWRSEQSATVSYSLAIDGRKVELPRAPVENHVLIASVPKGAPVYLEVTDEDRTQSVNLRDGSPGRDVIAAYNPVRGRRLAATHTFQGPVVTGRSSGIATIMTRLQDAALDPYHPDHGWAPQGRAWLQIDVHAAANYVASPGAVFLGGEFVIDPAAAFTLTGEGITPTPASSKTKITVDSVTGTGLVIFDVPSAFRSGSIAVVPAGEMRVEVDGATRPLTWPAMPPPWTVPVNLPV